MPHTKTDVIYTCQYVPPELIASCGLNPVRVMPDWAGVGGRFGQAEGLCPYARAFVNTAVRYSGDCAVVVTTACDQMRRGSEVVSELSDKPVFLMNIPAACRRLSAGLYHSELQRLVRFLHTVGGNVFSEKKLVAAMLHYDKTRMRLLKMADILPPRDFSEAITGSNRTGRLTRPPAKQKSSRQPAGSLNPVPIAIVGGPLFKEDMDVFDIVERTGGYIALDATETGLLGIPAAFDAKQTRHNPFAELTRAYFGSIPAPWRRPDTLLHKWLKRRVSQKRIRGVIFHRHVFCDLWHGQLQKIKKLLPVPVCDIDTADAPLTRRYSAGMRIEAFMETLL